MKVCCSLYSVAVPRQILITASDESLNLFRALFAALILLPALGPLASADSSVPVVSKQGAVAIKIDGTPFSLHYRADRGVSISENFLNVRRLGFGGWSLNVNHVYDSRTEILYAGNGAMRPATALHQWAIEAKASSERSSTNGSARQAIGKPNTWVHYDADPTQSRRAWFPLRADGSNEWLELGYANAVRPSEIQIRKLSASPGCITKIEAFHEHDKQWVSLWQGRDPTAWSYVEVFSPPLSNTNLPTRRLRITVDTSVPGWNGIDAVALVPAPPKGVGADEIAIPSRDREELFIFNHSGSHLRTINARTASPLYRFEYKWYNKANRLIAIIDPSTNITRIERNPAGDSLAIVAPSGQRTILGLNRSGDGYLTEVTDPSGQTSSLTYTNDWLLETSKDSRGNTYRFGYDQNEFLTEIQDPAGATNRWVRNRTTNGYEAILLRPSGETERYAFNRPQPDGGSSSSSGKSGENQEGNSGDGGSPQISPPSSGGQGKGSAGDGPPDEQDDLHFPGPDECWCGGVHNNHDCPGGFPCPECGRGHVGVDRTPVVDGSTKEGSNVGRNADTKARAAPSERNRK